MKYLIGFLLGLMVASVMADSVGQLPNGPALMTLPDVSASLDVTLMAGIGPDNKMAPIRVDKDGHVICSTEQPK